MGLLTWTDHYSGSFYILNQRSLLIILKLSLTHFDLYPCIYRNWDTEKRHCDPTSKYGYKEGMICKTFGILKSLLKCKEDILDQSNVELIVLFSCGGLTSHAKCFVLYSNRTCLRNGSRIQGVLL